MNITNFLSILVAILLSTNALATKKSCNRVEFPISFDSHGLPIIDIVISNKKQKALIDLGSSAGIHAPNDLIASLPNLKLKKNKSKSSDLSGKILKVKEYEISSMKINCMSFSNIIAREQKQWGLSMGKNNKAKVEGGGENKKPIIIGRGLFKNKKIEIDYSNRTLIFQSIYEPSTSFDKNGWHAFSMTDEGIVIVASSVHKNYKMVLDTGASSSIFRASIVDINEKLKKCDFSLKDGMDCRMFNSVLTLLGHKFESNILLYPIDERFKMDGILGNDFFNQFLIKFDFSNNSILLSPNTNK